MDAVFEFVKREKRVVFIREMFNGNDLTSKEGLVEYRLSSRLSHTAVIPDYFTWILGSSETSSWLYSCQFKTQVRCGKMVVDHQERDA